MGTELFTKDQATRYDDWYETPWGRYADQREKQLLLALAAPEPGETVLDVGCGTGRYLAWLRDLGLDAVGIESSAAMAQVTRQRLAASAPPVGGASLSRPVTRTAVGGASLPRSTSDRGEEAQVIIADGYHLPFADNSFDLVIAITALEFTATPEQFLSEMARVTRSRLFLGVLNKSSFYYLQQHRRKDHTLSQACFFSVSELLTLVRAFLDPVTVRWRTTLLGPATNVPILHTLTRCLDYIPGTSRLPWGAYMGMCLDYNW